jgi:hypothetical protein
MSLKTDRHWIHKKEHDIYVQDEVGLQNPESRWTIHLQVGNMASNWNFADWKVKERRCSKL